MYSLRLFQRSRWAKFLQHTQIWRCVSACNYGKIIIWLCSESLWENPIIPVCRADKEPIQPAAGFMFLVSSIILISSICSPGSCLSCSSESVYAAASCPALSSISTLSLKASDRWYTGKLKSKVVVILKLIISRFFFCVVFFFLLLEQNNDLMYESDHIFYTCGRVCQVSLALWMHDLTNNVSVWV